MASELREVTRWALAFDHGANHTCKMLERYDGQWVRIEQVATLPLLTPAAQRVLEAAAKFEEAKEAARVCWVELGHVTPSITNMLDKATDNMLSAVRAWRASLETAVPTGSVPVPPVPQEDR